VHARPHELHRRARAPARPSRRPDRAPSRHRSAHRADRARRPRRPSRPAAGACHLLRLITTADTEILATAAAVRRLPEDFPEVRCANPQMTRELDPFLDHVLEGARVVVIRVLGGRRGWQGGVDRLAERCRADGIALIALGGEARPDAEMTALSTVPSGAVAQAGEYLAAGDVDNVEQLLRFLADTFLMDGWGFAEPQPVEELGVYLPGRGDVSLD